MARTCQSIRHPRSQRSEKPFVTGHALGYEPADDTWQGCRSKRHGRSVYRKTVRGTGRRHGLPTLPQLLAVFFWLVLACPYPRSQRSPAFVASACEGATSSVEGLWFQDPVFRERRLSGSRFSWSPEERARRAITADDTVSPDTPVRLWSVSNTTGPEPSGVVAGTGKRAAQQRGDLLGAAAETSGRPVSSPFVSDREEPLSSLGYILEPPYNAGDWKKGPSSGSLQGQQLDTSFEHDYVDEVLQNDEEDQPDKENGRGRSGKQEDQPPPSLNATDATQAQPRTEQDKKKKSSFTIEFKFGDLAPLPPPTPPLVYIYPFLDKDKLHLFVNHGAPYSGPDASVEDPGARQESIPVPVGQYPLLNTTSTAPEPELLIGASSPAVSEPLLAAPAAAPSTVLRSSASHYYGPTSGAPYQSPTSRGYAANITGNGITEPISVSTEPRDVHFVFHVPDLMPSLQSSQALAAGPTWDRTSTINAGKLSSSTVPSSLSSPVFPVLRDPVLSTGAPPFPDIQRAYPAGTQNFPDLWFLAGQGMEDAQVPSGSLRAPGNPVFSRGEQAVVSNRDHSSVDRLQESLQRPVPGATGLPSLPEKLPEQNTSPQRPETAGLSTERTPTAAPGAMTNLPGSDNALAPPAALPQLGSLFALLTGIDADKLWRFFTGGSAPPRPANDPGPQASSPVPSFLTGPLHLSTLLPSTPLVPETARSGAQLLPKPLDPTSSIAALTALRGIFPPLEVLKFGMHLEAPEEEQATRLAPEGGARSPEPRAAAA